MNIYKCNTSYYFYKSRISSKSLFAKSIKNSYERSGIVFYLFTGNFYLHRLAYKGQTYACKMGKCSIYTKALSGKIIADVLLNIDIRLIFFVYAYRRFQQDFVY